MFLLSVSVSHVALDLRFGQQLSTQVAWVLLPMLPVLVADQHAGVGEHQATLLTLLLHVWTMFVVNMKIEATSFLKFYVTNFTI